MGFPLEASGTPHMDLVWGSLFSDRVGVVKIASEIIVGCSLPGENECPRFSVDEFGADLSINPVNTQNLGIARLIVPGLLATQ